MSRIFEALSRSESERLGTTLDLDSAAELLQTAEMQPPAGIREVAPVLAMPEPTEPQRQEQIQGFKKLALTPLPGSRVVCLTQQGSLGAEKLRLLALRLKNQREKRKLKKVLITSTMPSEGKSLMAANLAVTLARSKHLKTLLIECDLRRPTLAQVLLGRPIPGLSEHLQGSLPLSQVIFETEPSGFFFLPAGFPPVNPLELMQSPKFQTLLEQMNSTFDWILIDSPPVLPLADTSLLMRMSDGVVMVAREGVTEKKPLQKAVEAIDPSLLLGIVLNSCTNVDHENYYQSYKAGSSSSTPSET
jgi:capsular exopolysaccharide synthesis family protein